MDPNDVPQEVFDAALAEFQRAQDDWPPGSIAHAAVGWPLRCAIAAAVKAEREQIAEMLEAQAERQSQAANDGDSHLSSYIHATRVLRALRDAIRERGDANREGEYP